LANSSPRKQHCDHHGNLFTQAKLAKVTGLSEIVIGNLERGTKEHLEADILLKLADAFKLTTQERKEFLLAASNVEQAQFFHTEDLVQKVFGTMLPILEQLPTPAYLCDCFGDLIYVNPLFLAIFNLNLHTFYEFPATYAPRFNFMRVFFAPALSEQRQMMGPTWPTFARQTMLLFRLTSFRYQAHPYFQECLLPALLQYPLFCQFWQTPRTEEDDLFTNLNCLTLTHPEWGLLRFISDPIQATTPLGDLNLYAFHGLGQGTASACLGLTEKVGTGAIQFAPWPNPAFLNDPTFF
jgi:transcriptional regulator with XRE-family HTH domain